MSSKCKHIAVVGAGFSGAVIAHRLASAGYRVSVIESRSHIGSNRYTERDKAIGVLVHKYGPHIFHTDNHEVWSFINNFTEFKSQILLSRRSNNRVFHSLAVLATYRYLDMDKCIEEAMSAADQYLTQDASGKNIPAFY